MGKDIHIERQTHTHTDGFICNYTHIKLDAYGMALYIISYMYYISIIYIYIHIILHYIIYIYT